MDVIRGARQSKILTVAPLVTKSAVGKWFLVWTSIGCVFSMQLRWHYELSWSLSIFWGLADWYLWGLLALAIFRGVRALRALSWPLHLRLLACSLAAPALAAVHVALTMIVGSINDPPLVADWLNYFPALYAKKLTLNLLTVGAVVAFCEYVGDRLQGTQASFLARIGDATRVVCADQIIRGEVAGNYVNLHTSDGLWPVRETLTRMMQALPRRNFVQISRSGMVNLDCVRELISKDSALRIALTDGTEIPVARRHRARVRQALRDYCRSGTKTAAESGHVPPRAAGRRAGR